MHLDLPQKRCVRDALHTHTKHARRHHEERQLTHVQNTQGQVKKSVRLDWLQKDSYAEPLDRRRAPALQDNNATTCAISQAETHDKHSSTATVHTPNSNSKQHGIIHKEAGEVLKNLVNSWATRTVWGDEVDIDAPPETDKKFRMKAVPEVSEGKKGVQVCFVLQVQRR